MTPSPVDRLPKVGEVWRLAATERRGAIEAELTFVKPPWPVCFVMDDGQEGEVQWPVFRASARFVRDRG